MTLVRYAVAFFLCALLLMLLGLVFGYLSLNTAAPEDNQLAAAGALATLEINPRSGLAAGAASLTGLAYWSSCEYYGDCFSIHDDDDEELDEGGIGPWSEPYLLIDDEPVYEPAVVSWDWRPEDVWLEEPIYVIEEEPWYVSAFPGIGAFLQHVAFGYDGAAVRAPAPPPQRQSYPQPSCVISTHPGLIRVGQSASIAWGSGNARSAALSGVGAVPTVGGMYVAPRQTTVYTLTVFGDGNTSNACATRISVLP